MAIVIVNEHGEMLGLPSDRDFPRGDAEGMPPFPYRIPDDRDLPDSDDERENPLELPQSILLTESIRPLLERRHPDGQFFVGSNSGIYWTLTEPFLQGAVAPDWFYVPGVPPGIIDGHQRRSYVLWKEKVPPLIALEFVSGNGTEERDRTPNRGKFWIYENRVRVAYYGIYEVKPGRIELHAREQPDGGFTRVTPNERGHFPVPPLGVELGLWTGRFFGLELPWLRWFDPQGNLIPTNEERGQIETRRAEAETRRAEAAIAAAEKERSRAEALAARLRELGIDPDAV